MKKILIIVGILVLFSNNILNAQSWHTYFGDTLYFTTSTCPTHCPYVDVIYIQRDSIYFAGAIENAGELVVMGLVKWSNFQWYNLGIDWANDDIRCFIKYDNKLWVGGHSGWYPNWNSDLKYLSCWDGNSWSGPYTTKPTGAVFDLIEHNDTLFACGRFTEIDGIDGTTVKAYYDGNWIGIGHVEVNQGSSLEVYNNELLLGTQYTGIYRHTGLTEWTRLQGSPNGLINGMTVDTINNNLYIGGVFNYLADTIYSHNVGMWDGFYWHSLDSGLSSGDVYYKAMAMYKGDLYVGGIFDSTANGIEVNHIARWDGTDWHSLGNGANGSIRALAVFQDTLIVGGGFYEVGNSQRALAIAKWYMPDIGCNYLRPILYAYEEFGTAKDTFQLSNGEAEVKFYNNNAYVDTWNWDFGDSQTGNIKDPVHTYTDIGEYNVQLTVTDGECIKTASRTIYIEEGSGIAEQEIPEMQLYPNPTNNDFTVKVYLPSYNNVEFKITGINGELKEQIKITCETTVISTKGWKPGVYVCNLFIDGKLVKVEKLVFE